MHVSLPPWGLKDLSILSSGKAVSEGEALSRKTSAQHTLKLFPAPSRSRRQFSSNVSITIYYKYLMYLLFTRA